MHELGLSNEVTKDQLHDWVDMETHALDVVASWESLCDTYHSLEFTDQLNDITKLEEFKWIIQEMNKFLTRMRTKLMKCSNIESMSETLKQSLASTAVKDRKNLAYQKLKQRWLMQMVGMLMTMETEEIDGRE